MTWVVFPKTWDYALTWSALSIGNICCNMWFPGVVEAGCTGSGCGLLWLTWTQPGEFMGIMGAPQDSYNKRRPLGPGGSSILVVSPRELTGGPDRPDLRR